MPMTMIEIAFKGQLGGFALDIAFMVPAAGVTGLFGPSGCGKTTVLRCIAGLQQLTGQCRVRGDIWQDDRHFRPPHHRPIGYVFQEANLFPHLSVMGNLLYAGRGRRPPAAAAISFDEVVSLCGLGALLGRSPRHLSGGERQRIAIGRALLSQPQLLLMDEPLSALDAASKDDILPYLERLQSSLALPILYVSHDLDEIERLADMIVLLEAGRVLATGPLAALQSDPALPLLAGREAAVSLDALVIGHDATYGLLTLEIDGARLSLPAPPAAPGERRRLRIAAGDVSLAKVHPGPSTILNVLPATILTLRAVTPDEIVAVLALGTAGGAAGSGARLLSRVTRRSWDQLDLAPGQAVFAQVKSVALARTAAR